MRVSNPPSKPLLIWDGDCHFCRRWIERWRVLTADQVDYVTNQEIGERFPEIPRERLQSSVVYIDRTGNVFFAAEAAYRSLGVRSSRKWLSWSYDHVPGFAAISELGYRLVARNRKIASSITRMLWGDDVRPPTYRWARTWFLRLLGVVYLVAFVSLWTQVDGLIGKDGILPVADWLAAAHEQLGSRATWVLPTLCWINPGNAFLHFLCGGGVVLSILLIVGVAPALLLGALLVFYLSLAVAGQTFLGFQWDILLLETGFLSIFLAPWRLWWHRQLADDQTSAGRRCHDSEEPVNRVALFLLKLLLFKLMLMSGVVKLTSGDDSWWNLTALDYHYWSQPLPTVFAWWADKSPEWFKQFSVAVCLVIEIIVPFFIWAPRRPRLLAAGLLIFLQIVIAITGNYCFFNLLTLALCLLLIDDSVAASLCRGAGFTTKDTATERRGYNFGYRLSVYAAVVVLIVTLPINAWLIFSAFKPRTEPPAPIEYVYERIDQFHIVSGYGLFRVMTKDRREIVVEGSADGIDWFPYEFKWKPGDLKRAPGWCAPHQPRLDWQMWFAALGSARENRWFLRFAACLLEGKQDVIGLLQHNPFPEKPPRYVRATFYRYRFTTSEERRESGTWWKRQELGEYLQPVAFR